MLKAGETPQPLAYERRVVVFYDILGWRAHIERAGKHPERIAQLQRIILRFSQMLTLQQENYSAAEFRFSTFSDNVVISCPPRQDSITRLLGTLGSFQLGSVATGFLIRGGLTIGDIVHHENSVFGPALNRAYELESKIARVPRIIFDSERFAELERLPFFIVEEEGCRFIDPFTLRFVFLLKELDKATPPELWEKAGFSDHDVLHRQHVLDLLKAVLNGLKPSLRWPLRDEEWGKFSWAYDRVASQLGVPLAKSYPRVQPARSP